MTGATLLEGPRDRHLCLAVAHGLHEPVRRAWFDRDVEAIRAALDAVNPAATVLAGWDPDRTWWLNDVLEADEHPVRRATSNDADALLLGWYPVTEE